jgi:putative ABC transport system permease protein
MGVLGVSWPGDKGEWLPLIAGRPLMQSHFEMIADQKLGLRIGERLKLGKETYTIVGITRGMVTSGGDGLAAFSIKDAQAIQFDVPSEAVRLERAARRAHASASDIGATQPLILERASGASAAIPALGPPMLSAAIASLSPGADPESVKKILSGWSDVSVFSREEQKNLMLEGAVEMAKQQIGLFTTLLTVISAIIMALILYTLTMEKVHSIALLKLIGARDRVILTMILQQALLLGGIGYGLAYLIGQQVFPRFPRRVIVLPEDLMLLVVVVGGISVCSSLLGIWKALRIDPNEALSA